MRVPSTIIVMTLLGHLLSCLAKPNRRIGPAARVTIPTGKCSAVIQSGQETGMNLGDAFSGRGTAYARKGDYEHAFQDCDQARQLNPNDTKALYGRGTACWHKGDFDRAFQDYDQALRLNRNYANAFFGRGLAYAHRGDIDHAISDYDQALRLNPSLASAFYERGNAYALKT
jgi:tetratricopeptide (TPR) repeat protein